MANSPGEPALARRSGAENWGSKLGVILAVAGSAVGLGNFLRFPGTAAVNGGGVFMIPYFISMLILGIPICWVEWTMGRYGGSKGFNSAPGIFSVLWGRYGARYLGVLALIVPVVIYMYYVYIEAWCLSYALDYISGRMSRLAEGVPPEEEVARYRDHWVAFVGADANGIPSGRALLILGGVFVLNFFLIFRGLTKGIELFCKFAMPLLIIIALFILLRVLTLSPPDPVNRPEATIDNALGYMWNPTAKEPGQSTWAALADPELWLAASGQIFFSLSVGFGIILNYSSYLRRDDDVALSALTASSTNQFCEVCLGGLITIPVAFLFLGAADLNREVLDSTFQLGFHALPAVFHRMPLGDVFGFLFFFMLFMAAITSSLSMLQPAIAFLEEGFNLGRKVSVASLCLIVAMGGLIVIYFSKNALALDTMDYWVGTVCIYLLATVQVITVGWIFGIDRAKKEIDRGAELRVPNFFWFIIKYVSPVYLIIIFAGFCYQSLPGKVRHIMNMPEGDRDSVVFVLIFLLLLFIFFTVLVYLAGERWKLQDRKEEEVSI